MSVNFSELYEYEEVITSGIIAAFVALGLIQLLLCWKYVTKRLGKRKAFRWVSWYSLLLNVLVIALGYISDYFPVDYSIREVPRWYILYSAIVAAFVCYNLMWILALVVGKLVLLWKSWQKRRAIKRKAKEELRAKLHPAKRKRRRR